MLAARIPEIMIHNRRQTVNIRLIFGCYEVSENELQGDLEENVRGLI
jgi:hypothetical protein